MNGKHVLAPSPPIKSRGVSSGVHLNRASTLRGGSDPHANVTLWKQRLDPLGPFDDDHPTLFEQLGKADRFEVIWAVDAIGVEVIDRETAGVVDVEQDKRGAADGAGGAAQAPDEATDELCLSRAQVAVEGDAFATTERVRQFHGDLLGFCDAVGFTDHAWILRGIRGRDKHTSYAACGFASQGAQPIREAASGVTL